MKPRLFRRVLSLCRTQSAPCTAGLKTFFLPSFHSNVTILRQNPLFCSQLQLFVLVSSLRKPPSATSLWISGLLLVEVQSELHWDFGLQGTHKLKKARENSISLAIAGDYRVQEKIWLYKSPEPEDNGRFFFFMCHSFGFTHYGDISSAVLLPASHNQVQFQIASLQLLAMWDLIKSGNPSLPMTDCQSGLFLQICIQTLNESSEWLTFSLDAAGKDISLELIIGYMQYLPPRAWHLHLLSIKLFKSYKKSLSKSSATVCENLLCSGDLRWQMVLSFIKAFEAQIFFFLKTELFDIR